MQQMANVENSNGNCIQARCLMCVVWNEGNEEVRKLNTQNKFKGI